MYSESEIDYSVISRKELINAVKHGKIATELNGSAGFRMLMGYLKGQALEAMNALKDVDPHDAKLIMSLQNKVTRYDDLVQELKHLIFSGVQAEDTLQGE